MADNIQQTTKQVIKPKPPKNIWDKIVNAAGDTWDYIKDTSDPTKSENWNPVTRAQKKAKFMGLSSDTTVTNKPVIKRPVIKK